MPDFLFRNTETGALVRASADLPADARILVPDGTWQVALVSEWAADPVTVVTLRPMHVFLLAGQSNATCRAPFDGGTDFPAQAFQMERWRPLTASDQQPVENLVAPTDAQIIPATRPLHHHFRTPVNGMGWSLQFVIDYAAAHPEADVVLLPAARGSTGFSSGHWRMDGSLYADAVTRANALLAGYPQAEFRGILWHQGENDATNGMSAADYAAHLDRLITGFRSEISGAGATTPFVLGEMLPSWVAGAAARQVLQTVITQTPERLAYTAVASSAGTLGMDNTHFNAAGMRVMGARYAAALDIAAQNTGAAGWDISNQTINTYQAVSPPIVQGTTVTEGV